MAEYALDKRREQQKACYDAGECADQVPYYTIVCDPDDEECLLRKRRLAAKELENFRLNPTSSPILLVMAALPMLQWGTAAVRIAAGLIKRL